VPAPSENLNLANAMLEATRKIESALVQKLNCMYFVARKVSMLTVEAMQRKEAQQENKQEMYLKTSKELNQLINLYFSIEVEESMEVQIAGSEEERNDLMPLLYINDCREKATLESEIRTVLREYHAG